MGTSETSRKFQINVLPGPLLALVQWKFAPCYGVDMICAQDWWCRGGVGPLGGGASWGWQSCTHVKGQGWSVEGDRVLHAWAAVKEQAWPLSELLLPLVRSLFHYERKPGGPCQLPGSRVKSASFVYAEPADRYSAAETQNGLSHFRNRCGSARGWL